GERLLEWRAVRRVLSPPRTAKLTQGYREHGVKIVVTARHVAGLRAAAFLTAGIARVPFWRFLAADAGAALVGVPVSFGLAYLFADQVQGLLADVRRLERWLVLAVVVAAGAWIGVSAWRRSRRP
ncbi:MAG: VTT domain-containing protein, partial [Candidatus Rokubacteria bacterium]|nr:VTT domain-containing protein [Candidatus Rokubacteria bacterium]